MPIDSMCARLISFCFIKFEVRAQANKIYLFIVFSFGFFCSYKRMMRTGDANGILPFDRRQLKAYFIFLLNAHGTRASSSSPLIFFFAWKFRIHNRYRLFCFFSYCDCRRLVFCLLCLLVLNIKLHNKQLFCRCSTEKDYSIRFGSMRCDAMRCVREREREWSATHK